MKSLALSLILMAAISSQASGQSFTVRGTGYSFAEAYQDADIVAAEQCAPLQAKAIGEFRQWRAPGGILDVVEGSYTCF